MNREFTFYNAILLMIAFLIFTSGNYTIIDASKHNNSSGNYKDSTFFLPFNSHIADQSFNENRHTSDLIPFP